MTDREILPVFLVRKSGPLGPLPDMKKGKKHQGTNIQVPHFLFNFDPFHGIWGHQQVRRFGVLTGEKKTGGCRYYFTDMSIEKITDVLWGMHTYCTWIDPTFCEKTHDNACVAYVKTITPMVK